MRSDDGPSCGSNVVVGNLTNDASNLRDYGQVNMRAAIAVRSTDNVEYYLAYEEFVTRENIHVEQRLMQKLYIRYNEFQGIPNNSKIIFVCTWSPCMSCTNELIPDFMKRIRYREKFLRVKFRFQDYYSRDRYQCGVDAWSTVKDAQEAYADRCRKYGIHSAPGIFIDHEAIGGAVEIGRKFKSHLVIQIDDGARTSPAMFW